MSMRSLARAISVPLLACVVAEFMFRWNDVSSEVLAPPSAVARAAVTALADGSMTVATWETIVSTLSGVAIGGGAGMMIGLLLGLSPIASGVTSLTIDFVRPVPSVALIPLTMLIFGFGYWMEISVVAFATFWPCLILARTSIGQIDAGLYEVSRTLRLTPLAQLTKIILPAVLPRLFVALRLSIGIAFVVSVTVEIAANPQGLGYFMMEAQNSLRPDLMLAGLLWVGCVGWATNWLMLSAEALLFRNRAAPTRGAA